jgi:hypothetical protein
VVTSKNACLKPNTTHVVAAVLAGVAFLLPASMAEARTAHPATAATAAATETGAEISGSSAAVSEAEAEAQFEAELLEAEEEAAEGPGAPKTSSPTTVSVGQKGISVSGLRLASATVAALNSRRVRTSEIHFLFAMEATAEVRVSLSRQFIHSGQVAFHQLPGSLSMTAKRGVNSGHLNGTATLGAGIYRLTLTPTRGSARSVFLHVA